MTRDKNGKFKNMTIESKEELIELKRLREELGDLEKYAANIKELKRLEESYQKTKKHVRWLKWLLFGLMTIGFILDIVRFNQDPNFTFQILFRFTTLRFIIILLLRW